MGSASDPVKENGKQRYHPSEDIVESSLVNGGEDARLTAAETARTVIEVSYTDDIGFIFHSSNIRLI